MKEETVNMKLQTRKKKKKAENKKTRKEGMEKITLELNLILGNIMLAAFYKHNW